jgi:hypothetical protein
MRWERGIFKFDKAIEGKVDLEGRIPSEEYWFEAGKADDRIMLPAPRTVVPYTGAQQSGIPRFVIPQGRYKMPPYHVLDREPEPDVGLYEGSWTK